LYRPIPRPGRLMDICKLENEPKPRLYLGKPRTYQTVGCWEFEKEDGLSVGESL
jgi:hypothetical protein